MAPSQQEVDALKASFSTNGQGHVFQFWDSLSQEQRDTLVKQLSDIDVVRVNNIYETATGPNTPSTSSAVKPLPDAAFDSVIGDANAGKVKEWEQTGMKLIGEGKVAVILLAGGQGTRLGSSEPKGCYDINLPSHKTLFQMQAERIIRMQKLAEKYANGKEVVIPWYVMTSGPTRAATEAFFKSKNYFGLRTENIFFFNQGVLPAFGTDGKILMESKFAPAVAPDGNGGIYAALLREGVIADLERRGTPYVHAYCVDNCLVKVADPVFIGYCVSKNAECGAKVVPKTHAEEPVGVICQRNGRYAVVEYSEIDPSIAAQKDPKTGALVYNAANIVNHFYTTDFLRRIKSFESQLEYHIARKKIPHVDVTTGQTIKPTSPNGIKLELFIFDVFPFTDRFAVLEVQRKEEFSPLKNATGADSPQTSRADILAQCARFVEAAGGKIQVKDGEEKVVEVSPLVSYGGEGLEALKGKTVKSPAVIASEADLRQLE
ncbi:UDP-N-acetylglucosamine pyrophosphorylase [Borealophlyctis nickersoniae]|nr:UDP-N-acetylglucosamine pyrophosphorylase [Borealophlyctis nickersoniae]